MSKPSKLPTLGGDPTRLESIMEKTSRAAREIVDEQNAERDRKTERLREARRQRQADATYDPEIRAPETALDDAEADPDGKD